MNENINNLFNFYREAGACPSVSLIEEDHFCAVSGLNNSWPQMVFGLELSPNPATDIGQILTKTVSENLPGFAVCNADFFNMQSLEILREKDIYPVKIWTLMNARSFASKPHGQQKNVEIRKLQTTTELHDFMDLINAEFLQSAKMNPVLAEEMNDKDAFSFYGLFAAGELVSGLLAFSDLNTTGLYFIATKRAFRGKGLAAGLIRHVTSLCRQETNKVVLQATQKAVPLYTRLGFSVCGKMVIFWKR